MVVVLIYQYEFIQHNLRVFNNEAVRLKFPKLLCLLGLIYLIIIILYKIKYNLCVKCIVQLKLLLK